MSARPLILIAIAVIFTTACTVTTSGTRAMYGSGDATAAEPVPQEAALPSSREMDEDTADLYEAIFVHMFAQPDAWGGPVRWRMVSIEGKTPDAVIARLKADEFALLPLSMLEMDGKPHFAPADFDARVYSVAYIERLGDMAVAECSVTMKPSAKKTYIYHVGKVLGKWKIFRVESPRPA